MAVKVTRSDVIAFRLHAHHLSERLSRSGLPAAAGRCGVQNSPPGSALLALHARVRGLTQDRLDQAVAEDKSLLQSWCMRGAPFYFPTVDAPVFTTGVLPPTEEVMRHFILGAGPAVDKLGLGLTEAVELTGAEIGDVLTGRRLAIDALGSELAERIAHKLPKKQRDIWEQEGPHAAGQPLGEAVVHFCIRILTLQRVVCFAPRAGNKAPFVLTEEWLRDPIPDTDPQAARAELLRRYLRCYGPSTRADFAAWLGVRAGDAAPWWSLVEDEMTQVDFGRKTWVLAEDLDTLRSPPTPVGVRLLPPRDPYTQVRDRETIVDKKYHRDVWKTVGEPGAVLAGGEITGIWRPRKSGQKLTISVQTFGPLAARDRKALEAEAEQITPLRGASSVTVEFDTH
ncbi:winged helix DNA-binding domain-containing protein [Streptomyces boninensis]|uniref:winged helix DNA-binding domain-containing protein n=1 Tax=Streptomyces boninensis TaxID=2039455 RepID=UPI003B20E8CE